MTLDNNLSKIDLLDGTINLFVSEKFNVIKKRVNIEVNKNIKKILKTLKNIKIRFNLI